MTDVERTAIAEASKKARALHRVAQRQYAATISKHGMPSREENRAFYLRMYLQSAMEDLERAEQVAQEIAQMEREEAGK